MSLTSLINEMEGCSVGVKEGMLKVFMLEYLNGIIEQTSCDFNCSDFGNLEGDWCNADDMREIINADFN